jgi:hypothetical protein
MKRAFTLFDEHNKISVFELLGEENNHNLILDR